MSPRAFSWMQRALGLVLLGLVVTVYAGSLGEGRWPPSHPWSGITLLVLGSSFLVLPTPVEGRRLLAKRVASAAALLSALAWAYSARG